MAQSKKLSILHLPAYAVRGGCEKNCLHFIAGSPQHEHAVVVLGTEGPMSAEWRDAGARVYHLDILKENVLTFGSKLLEYLKGKRHDVAIPWSTIRLPQQLHALDSVTSVVKVYLGNPIGKNYRPLKDVLFSMIFRHRSSVELMACSAYVSQSYRNSPYYSRFSIRVSLNPIPVPVPRPAHTPASGIMQVGMVARLDRIKDQATVLRAFALLPGHLSFHLHIVGDGDQMSKLKALATSLGIAGNVTFHGDVKDVYRHLQSWHLFTYATTPEEGLGSAVAEAMANGLACILSDLPMLRELAPGDECVWFEAGNAEALAEKIVELQKDPVRCSQLGENAYAHALRSFGVKRFINDYIAA